MTKILKYFLQGLLVFIPLGVTILLFIKLFQFFEGIFSFAGFTPSPFLNTVISFTLLLVFITLLGILASSFVFKRLFAFFENRLEQMPVIKHIYSPIKDFINAFMGNKKRFTKPVLVLTNPQANIQEIGFVTCDDLLELEIKEKIAVYLPMSFSFSGRLIIVSKNQVTPLNIDGADAMKFIVSGGLTDIDKE